MTTAPVGNHLHVPGSRLRIIRINLPFIELGLRACRDLRNDIGSIMMSVLA
jgi:hypothetical protein